MTTYYKNPSSEQFSAFAKREIEGEIIMLNLLKFNEWADYTDFPELAPAERVSGKAAYKLYERNAFPFIGEVGAKVTSLGAIGDYVIGPDDKDWDKYLLVHYPNKQSFLNLVGNPAYQAIVGHRTASMNDSRLLPMLPKTK